ncbi:hypothetical protein DH86_00001383 [Scytalidium sp. 3C]|nr:hypothetical protein DH86_00001383 [Scytalidium sp. 3C]
MRFHPPFTPEKREKMQSFWKERFDQAVSKRRIIIGATIAKTSEGEQAISERELCGMVELGMPETDTGPFRGDVEMLMVSPKYRRHGLAKKLMYKLEEIALEEGRTLLVGVVPNYGIVPNTGELVDGAYFYKDLRV